VAVQHRETGGVGQPVRRTRPPSRRSRDGARRRDAGLKSDPAHTLEQGIRIHYNK